MKKVQTRLLRAWHGSSPAPLIALFLFSASCLSYMQVQPVYAQTQAEATECYNANNGKARNELLSNGSCLVSNGGNCEYTSTGVVCSTGPGGGGAGTTSALFDSGDACTDQEDLSLSWDINGDGCNNTGDVVTMIFRLLAGLVGIAVVSGIVWGGMLYASSNGNAAKAQQGITVIINAIIGLLLFIFMFAITNFLVPGGVIG